MGRRTPSGLAPVAELAGRAAAGGGSAGRRSDVAACWAAATLASPVVASYPAVASRPVVASRPNPDPPRARNAADPTIIAIRSGPRARRFRC
jgi:hypothetical protein